MEKDQDLKKSGHFVGDLPSDARAAPQKAVYAVAHGTTDWRHAAWAGSFYPGDMPEEWRLAYYQTRFRCVWLASSQWRQAPLADLAGWAGEVAGGFRFILEYPRTGLTPEDHARLAVLGDSLIGPWPASHTALIWVDAETDWKVLAERVRLATLEKPLFVLAREADYPLLERLDTLLHLLAL